MKFLTDENIYTQIVEAIRSLSHDVLDVKEQNLFSMPDNDIIQMAQNTGRILITSDKDFSNILSYPPSQHQGIIVFASLSSLLRQPPTFIALDYQWCGKTTYRISENIVRKADKRKISYCGTGPCEISLVRC